MVKTEAAGRESLRAGLIAGAQELKLELSPRQLESLLDYLQLFAKWNRAYNLSAVRDIGSMLPRHLLDSLSILPCLNSAAEGAWLDVGSGGGLPGIPLAIAFPDRSLTLLDSNGKKTRFLFQVRTELGLDRVQVEQARVESFAPPQRYSAIFSRAFAGLRDFVLGAEHLLAEGGRYYAMKGQFPEDELRQIEKPFTVEGCHPLKVPGETGARHLVVIGKDQPTRQNNQRKRRPR